MLDKILAFIAKFMEQLLQNFIAEAQCEDRRDTLRTERSEDEKTEDKEKAE